MIKAGTTPKEHEEARQRCTEYVQEFFRQKQLLSSTLAYQSRSRVRSIIQTRDLRRHQASLSNLSVQALQRAEILGMAVAN